MVLYLPDRVSGVKHPVPMHFLFDRSFPQLRVNPSGPHSPSSPQGRLNHTDRTTGQFIKRPGKLCR